MTTSTIFRLGSKGLEPMTLEGKDNLQPGTVLHLNGYNNPDYVIIGKRKSDYFSGYLTVSLEDYRQSQVESFALDFLKDKTNDRIQMYITDKILPADELSVIWEKSEVLRKEKEQKKTEAEIIRNRKIEEGKRLFEKYIPKNAQAIIVAEYIIDDSDSMTDYFANHTEKTVILAYSLHKRDIFSEMRKAAGKYKETLSLATGNKAIEHRHKWSMGAGYFLSEKPYSGWRVSKKKKYHENWEEDLYVSMADFCIFNKGVQ